MLSAPIVGNHFRGIAEKAFYNKLVEAGEGTVILRRDPDNPYDDKAIEVWCEKGQHHLGFIPRAVNSELAAAMDAGEKFTAHYDGGLVHVEAIESEDVA